MANLEKKIARLIYQYQGRTGKLLTIGSVESATGGRICDRITNIPGSSDYYKGSIIAYSNEIKTDLVAVKKETLKIQGAVSSEVAIEMAEGGRKLLKVDICISDTGIAGPAGATPEKPVGLFYLGLSANDISFSRKHKFEGNREQNKKNATEAVLTLLDDYLQTIIGNLKDNSLDEKHVVTCFLQYKNKVLILRRSSQVGSYQGKWAGVSGYIETSELEQAYIEVKEETGLDKDDIKLKIKGKPIKVTDKKLGHLWVIHPFLFRVKSPSKIKIDWEHSEMKWIKPEELSNYKTVPGLNDVLDCVIHQAQKPKTIAK